MATWNQNIPAPGKKHGNAADQAAMLALTGVTPSAWVHRTDTDTAWQYQGGGESTLANWQEWPYPVKPSDLGSAAYANTGDFDPAGSAASALNSARGYTDAEINALSLGTAAQSDAGDFDAAGSAASAVSTHVGQADPHTQYQKKSEKGQPSGYVPLEGDGTIDPQFLPPIAVVEYLGDVADQMAMLHLVGEKGDWCVRTDTGTAWIIIGNDPSVIGDWKEMGYPTAPVTSVNTKTGAVSLDTDDVPEGSTNLYFTDERAQDAIGTALTDTATIDFTYDDAGDKITADVKDASITPVKTSFGIGWATQLASAVPFAGTPGSGKAPLAVGMQGQVHPGWIPGWVAVVADSNIDIGNLPATIDGQSIPPNYPVLFAGQTDLKENGPYRYTSPGNPAARTQPWNGSGGTNAMEAIAQTIFLPIAGTHAGELWTCVPQGATLDVHDIVVGQIGAGGGSIVANDITDATTAGRALLTAANVAAQLSLLGLVPSWVSKTANFTAVAGDFDGTGVGLKRLKCDKSSTLQITINTGSAPAVGAVMTGRQGLAGQVEFVASGVTINSRFGSKKTAGQWSWFMLVYEGSNVYSLTGDLE